MGQMHKSRQHMPASVHRAHRQAAVIYSTEAILLQERPVSHQHTLALISYEILQGVHPIIRIWNDPPFPCGLARIASVIVNPE
jgi:hypothetical protein